MITMLSSEAIAEEAEDNIFTSNVQMLLPGQPAIADGSTEITYYFLFLDTKGKPMENLSGKVTLGKLKENVRDEKNGVYSATFKPEKVTNETELSLSVNLRNSNRQTVKQDFTVKLRPANTRTFQTSASPEEITLGLDDFVSLTIEQTSGPLTSQINISSSVGSVDNVVNLGDGKFSARYTPPNNRPYPHIALFTIVDLENPENTAAFTLNQKGKTNFPVNSLPDSNVILQIAGRDFGPVKTDSSGKATIPIVVPPGVAGAKLIVISNGNRTEEPLDLRIPQNVPRINFFPNPPTIPADGKTSVSIQVYVATTTGKPDKNATLLFKAEKGNVTPVKNNGNGVYSVLYTPPLENRKSSDNIRVVLQSETGDVTDNLPLNLSPTLPEDVQLTSAAKVLPKNASSFNVITKLKDRKSNGMIDRGIHFTANGAKVLQSKELGSGDYTTKFSPTSNGPIEITAFAKGSISDNPPFGITMIPNHHRLVNNGLSNSLLTFIIYDQYGYPIANQDVDLRIVSGDGSLPSQIKTNSTGVGQVSFTAGRTPGIVIIEAKSETHTSQFSLLQMPENVLPKLKMLPKSQNNAYHRLEGELQKSIAYLRIEREGMEGAAIKAQLNQQGDVKQISIKAEPAKIVPSGKITLQIRTTDDTGNGIAGEKLETLVSSGTVGRMQDLGGGEYSVSLIAPDTIGDPIQVTVTTVDGPIQKKIQIDWVASQTIVEASNENPNKIEKPKKERTPREPRNIPISWLRASAGFSGGYYHYQQVPIGTDGKLYREAITFNSVTSGSSPAPSAGAQIRVLGSIPVFEYLGYDVNISMDRYSVLLSEFGEEPIGDFLSSFDFIAMGQYPFEVNSVTLIPAARLGFIQDDLLLFLQEQLTEDKVSLSYQPLWVSSLALGIGAQVETNFGLFGSFNYDVGLRGSSSYKNKLVGQVGYTLPGNVFIFGGGKSSIRNVDIEDDTGKIGEIHDMHRAFTVGLGYGIPPIQ